MNQVLQQQNANSQKQQQFINLQFQNQQKQFEQEQDVEIQEQEISIEEKLEISQGAKLDLLESGFDHQNKKINENINESGEQSGTNKKKTQQFQQKKSLDQWENMEQREFNDLRSFGQNLNKFQNSDLKGLKSDQILGSKSKQKQKEFVEINVRKSFKSEEQQIKFQEEFNLSDRFSSIHGSTNQSYQNLLDDTASNLGPFLDSQNFNRKQVQNQNNINQFRQNFKNNNVVYQKNLTQKKEELFVREQAEIVQNKKSPKIEDIINGFKQNPLVSNSPQQQQKYVYDINNNFYKKYNASSGNQPNKIEDQNNLGKKNKIYNYQKFNENEPNGIQSPQINSSLSKVPNMDQVLVITNLNKNRENNENINNFGNLNRNGRKNLFSERTIHTSNGSRQLMKFGVNLPTTTQTKFFQQKGSIQSRSYSPPILATQPHNQYNMAFNNPHSPYNIQQPFNKDYFLQPNHQQKFYMYQREISPLQINKYKNNKQSERQNENVQLAADLDQQNAAIKRIYTQQNFYQTNKQNGLFMSPSKMTELQNKKYQTDKEKMGIQFNDIMIINSINNNQVEHENFFPTTKIIKKSSQSLTRKKKHLQYQN